MSMKPLLDDDYNITLERRGNDTYVTVCGETFIATDDGLENLEYILTDILHAISLYKRGLSL